MKIISIVIVNWNTRALLHNLLVSLYEHAPCRDFEIIVVDNNSNDDSPQMIADEFPDVRVLINSSNMGFARAVNRGIHESSGKYILLLNTDLVLVDGSIDLQVDFMEANLDCAFCGGLLVSVDGIPHDVYGQFPSVKNLIAEILPHRVKWGNRISHVPPIDQTCAMRVDYVSGADLMVRRTFLESVGLLDEQFFMYFEDADLGLRAKQSGWDVYYVPSVRYIHHGGGSLDRKGHKPYWIPSLGLYLRKHYRGVEFISCWFLCQMLRLRYMLSKAQLQLTTRVINDID